MAPVPIEASQHRWEGVGGVLAAVPRSRIAQLVEQPAVNRQVVGSSPTPGAKLSTDNATIRSIPLPGKANHGVRRIPRRQSPRAARELIFIDNQTLNIQDLTSIESATLTHQCGMTTVALYP